MESPLSQFVASRPTSIDFLNWKSNQLKPLSACPLADFVGYLRG